MKKNFLIKLGAVALASTIVLGGTVGANNLIFAQGTETTEEKVVFKKVGVVKLEYSVDDGEWKRVDLKMKKESNLRSPEVTVSALGSQDIDLPKEYIGKKIKFRADFIDTTEENAQPKLINEECRIFDGVTKEDITVLKYTYEGDTEEENEATYSLSSQKVSGLNNSIMNVNINFGDSESGTSDSSEGTSTGETSIESNFTQVSPIIEYTNIIENYAVAGATVARLSMPEGINNEGVVYKFDESNNSPEAIKVRNIFEIVGNEVRIRSDFDSYEFGDSTIEGRTISDRVYNDAKRHIKEDRSFWFGFYAVKGETKSQIAYTYDNAQSRLVIGKHIEEIAESENQFRVTKLEYYLGDKSLVNVLPDDWKRVADKELEKINATSGHLGSIADGYVGIATDIAFKEVDKLNLYIRVTTDKTGSVIYGNSNSDKLVADITSRGVKEKDGRAYGVISVMHGQGANEIWRSFNIKVYPSVKSFTSFVYENVEVSAEEGVLPAGTRIVVFPIVADELASLKEKLGADRLNTYVSAEDIQLVDYAGQRIQVPEGKEVTVRIAKPAKVNNSTIRVFHMLGDNIEEKSVTLDDEGYIVFKTNSFSPYVIVAESTVGTEEGDKEDEMPAVNVDETENNTGNDGEVPTTSEETPAVEPGTSGEKPIVEPGTTEEKPNSDTEINNDKRGTQGSEDKTVISSQNDNKVDNLPKTGIEDDIIYTLCLLIPIAGLAVCALLALKKKNI